jgi:hypothetical protein
MHLDTISGGNLQYILLDHSSDVTSKVQQGALDVDYAGLSTLKASIVLALKGRSVGLALNREQQYFVQEILTAYLAEKTVGLMNAVVCGTSIANQRGPGVGQRQIRSLQDASTGDGWIELTFDVFATLTPPYTAGASFDQVILSPFRSSQKDFITDLQTDIYRPEFQLQGKLGDYFAGVSQVNVRSASDAPPSGGSVKILGLSQAAFSVVCVAAIVVTGVWIWCLCRKYRRRNTGEVIYVDSTGARRRRSSVMFLMDGNKGTRTDKGLKIGEVVSTHEVRATRTESVDKFESTHSRSRSEGTRSTWDTTHDVRVGSPGGRSELILPNSQFDNGDTARVGGVSRPDVSRSTHSRQHPERINLHENSRHRSGEYAQPSRGSSHVSTVSSGGISKIDGHDEDLAAALRISNQQDKVRQMRVPSSSVHTRREEPKPLSTNNSRISTMSNSSHHNRSVGSNADGPDEDIAVALQLSLQEEKLRQMRVLSSSSAHSRREVPEPLSRNNSRISNMSNSSHHNRSVGSNADGHDQDLAAALQISMQEEKLRHMRVLSSSAHARREVPEPLSGSNERVSNLTNSSNHSRRLEANYSGAVSLGVRVNSPPRIKASSTIAKGDSEHTTRGQRTIHGRKSAPVAESSEPSFEAEHDKELAAALRLSSEENISRHPHEYDDEINAALLQSIQDQKSRQLPTSTHTRRGELAPGFRYPPVDMNARPTMGKTDNRSFGVAASSHNRQHHPFANEDSVHSTRASRTPVPGREPSYASESASHSRSHDSATMRFS